MDFTPGHDAGRRGTSTGAGRGGAPRNAPGLLALCDALASMIPAAALAPEVPGTEHPAGPDAIASPDGVEAEAIDRIRALERLKSAVSAAQVRETAALHAHRIETEARHGVPRDRRGRGLGAEIGLARRIGPHSGSTELRKAVNIAADLPNTLAALQDGTVSAAHAAAVERQSHWLDPEGRRAVDHRVAEVFGHAGVREVTRAAQAEAAAHDPVAAEQRFDENRRERRVSITPSESTPGMAYLTAFLPIEQAAACYQGLVAEAARRIAEGEAGDWHAADPTDGPRAADRGGAGQADREGDAGQTEPTAQAEQSERTPMQVLADTLVEWLTGQGSARDVPVEVHLVMTDAALFGGDVPEGRPDGRRTDDVPSSGSPNPPNPHRPSSPPGPQRLTDPPSMTSPPHPADDQPAIPPGRGTRASRSAWLPGFGAIPAPTARRLLANTEGRFFLRRLFTIPETGQLAAMDSQRRTFTGALRRMILVRDGTCRTPSCGAPIRHLDHATPYRDGGPTRYENGSGLCVRCNLTKEHPGWRHDATAESLTVTTPTGHRYLRPTAPLVPPDLADWLESVIAADEDLARDVEHMTRLAAEGRSHGQGTGGGWGPVDMRSLVLRRVLGYDGTDLRDAA